ncbi:hypothetical protein AXF42_Ash010720 [Apostasia shenzhenica]|uniref:Uncharacterized protein n=1 Tax=Apostasia shenzhenica TaxID=1088818 RepID=A0A2I0A0G8_9ASPA|nr:hypothetical protein AXF42_Ash010720 [Apostasia shenzhenica]
MRRRATTRGGHSKEDKYGLRREKQRRDVALVIFMEVSLTMASQLQIFPEANPSVLEQLRKVECVVYAMGSLYTSICPSLVLLLNGSHDRETFGLSASGFVTAITDALNRTYGDPHKCLQNLVSAHE